MIDLLQTYQMNIKCYISGFRRTPEAIQIRRCLIFSVNSNLCVRSDFHILKVKAVFCYEVWIVQTGTCTKRSANLLHRAIIMMSR